MTLPKIDRDQIIRDSDCLNREAEQKLMAHLNSPDPVLRNREPEEQKEEEGQTSEINKS